MAVVKTATKFNPTARDLVLLLMIAAALYLLSPTSGLIKASDSGSSDEPTIYYLTIKNAVLSDPHQSDIRVKVGTRDIIAVTTDQDGRLDMSSSGRDLFNPVFSGLVNSIGIPTDKPGSYRLEFHPNAEPNKNTPGLLIGTVIVE